MTETDILAEAAAGVVNETQPAITLKAAQPLADTLATLEWLKGLELELLGRLPGLIDAAAREANLAGRPTMACQKGPFHARVGQMFQREAEAFCDYGILHVDLIGEARQINAKLPKPAIRAPELPPETESGGR